LWKVAGSASCDSRIGASVGAGEAVFLFDFERASEAREQRFLVDLRFAEPIVVPGWGIGGFEVWG